MEGEQSKEIGIKLRMKAYTLAKYKNESKFWKIDQSSMKALDNSSETMKASCEYLNPLAE